MRKKPGIIAGFGHIYNEGELGMRRQGLLWCIVLLICLIATLGTFSWATPSDIEDVTNVTGLVAFTAEANYMSLPGYLRWQYFIDHQEWITMLEALPAVKSQGINPAWPTWKTIQLGTHKSAKDLHQAVDKEEYIRLTPEGDDILKRITVAPQPTEIKLVVVTVAQLGFPNGATRAQIYKKALSLGLQLCPTEVGPQLRLQYMDQPLWEYIIVGTEPISSSDGRLGMFGVVYGPIGRGLYGYEGLASHFWSSRYRWVFCQHFIDHKK